VGEPLDQQRDDGRRLVADQEIGDLQRVDVTLVPGGDHEAGPEADRLPPVEQREAEPAALRHHGQAAGHQAGQPPAVVHGRAERGGHPVGHIEEPLAVRPEQPDPGVAGDLGQLPLRRPARLVLLGEAGAEDDHAPRPGGRAVGDHARHERGPDRDDGQVNGLRDGPDGRVAGQSADLLAVRVDQVDLAVVGVLLEHRERPAGQGERVVGRADDRDAARP
jgi:hypothetical protein